MNIEKFLRTASEHSRKTYSEPSQTSKMEHFAKIVNDLNSIFDVWQGSEYTSVTGKIFFKVNTKNTKVIF